MKRFVVARPFKNDYQFYNCITYQWSTDISKASFYTQENATKQVVFWKINHVHPECLDVIVLGLCFQSLA